MDTIRYKLTASQYIDDLDIELNELSYITHLNADTGYGKSSWVMGSLGISHNIIFAVPQRAQITQLQAKYSHRSDIDFIYGGQHTLSDNPTTIVCTYDQLPSIQAKIFTDQYILVIDEVHKLYQAASYRAEAIAKLLDAVKDERFLGVLTMSATFTSELVPFQIDTWLEVTKSSVLERRIDMRIYNDLAKLEDDVLGGLDAQGIGPTVIRINNKANIQAYQTLLEDRGYSSLAVSRDSQESESVQTMLTRESIAEYDVILTTSLLDEAININDSNVHEVIVFNSRIHPEELKQFVGRFRHCNPNIKLCVLGSLIGGQARELKLLKQSQLAIVKAARELAVVIQQDCDVIQAVRKANATLASLFGFEPLRVNHSQIVANEPAVMASLYKADIQLCYRSVEGLEDTLKDIFPGLTVNIAYVDGGRDVENDADIDAVYDAISAQWCRALATSKQAVNLEAVRITEADGVPEDMPTLIEEVSERFGKDTLEYGILRRWAELNRDVIINTQEAFDVMEKGREAKVWHFHHTAESNLYIQPVLRRLRALPLGTMMTLEDARSFILEALRQVSQQYVPFKDMIASARVPGLAVKRNNHFSVTDRFVRSIFRDYTATPPVRSNNKDKIVFNGIGPFGYQYRLKEPMLPRSSSVARRIRRIRKAVA